MIQTIVEFLVLLSPYALFLYLRPVMKELPPQNFIKLLLKATIISFAIFFVFLLTGDFIFK
jgi:multiple antibiotic resistance protein